MAKGIRELMLLLKVLSVATLPWKKSKDKSHFYSQPLSLREQKRIRTNTENIQDNVRSFSEYLKKNYSVSNQTFSLDGGNSSLINIVRIKMNQNVVVNDGEVTPQTHRITEVYEVNSNNFKEV